MGRGYEGAEAFGRGTFGNLGEESNIWRLGTVCVCWFDIFWFGVWVDCCRGALVAGSFGLGGQESSWSPVARESDRLCS
jgi:hypothetical protein